MIKKIIFDTDLGGDCDDAGALAVLHVFADMGEAELLCVTHSNSMPYAPGAIEVINNYYGRTVPIGCYKPEGLMDEGYDNYAYRLATEFPSTVTRENAWDATGLLRKTLTSQPDGSVTIVTVGQLTNMELLLNSKPDKYSDLTGVELVASKVLEFSVMGGHFPEPGEKLYLGDYLLEHEFNIEKAAEAAAAFIDLSPVPVTFLPFKTGMVVKTGGNLLEQDNPLNPVTAAYRYYENSERESWDLTAVLYAVRGYEPFWKSSGWGRISIDGEGVTVFKEEPGVRHRYMLEKGNADDIREILNELLIREPKQMRIPAAGAV